MANRSYVDFSKLPLDRLHAITAGTDSDLQSHHARILADREIVLRRNMAGRCATCRTPSCSCSSEAWLGQAEAA